MQQALEGLMIERDVLAWKVQNCRLVLTPVRQLPADVLHEIFLFACARSTKILPISTPFRPPYFRVSLMESHGGYLSAALATIKSIYREYDNIVHWVSGVSMALARSATCPLWLTSAGATWKALSSEHDTLADIIHQQITLHILSRARHIRLLTFSKDQDNESLQYAPNLDHDIELGPILQFITMAHLADLIIANSSYDVLANICTPSLECLVIRGGSPGMLTRAENMLQRSGCTLRRLTLQGLTDGHSDSVDHIDVSDSLIRQCGGSLLELSLLRIDAGTHFVIRLLSSVQSLSFLCVLAFDISYVRAFCIETQNVIANELLTFLESRRRLSVIMSDEAVSGVASCTELEAFTLHAPAEGVFDFTDAQHQRIKALRASGLLFYICRYNTTNKDPRMY
ncbi:hypothetical protein BDZ89DRAFT_1048714 [Hymenopellis radicata]|nr:hypothetical protein BDZ89DRAFT_1048714 [Hymenopellis radicata]